MFFSLIIPTPGAEREAAIQWSQGPYELHQWIWRFLPAQRGAPRDFLFRCRDGDDKSPGFYVVSKRQPKPINENWQIESREYDPRLSVGMRLTFELRANPVISHKVNNKTRRDDVVMHAKRTRLKERGWAHWSDWSDDDPGKPSLYDLVHATCSSWLESRSAQSGFKLVNEANDRKVVRVDGYIQQRAANKEIQFSSVDFSGELEVIDVTAFRRTLFAGIGPAKAFGCGLMLVKRA